MPEEPSSHTRGVRRRAGPPPRPGWDGALGVWLLLAVVAGPLLFGAVRPWSANGLSTLILLGGATWFVRRRPAESEALVLPPGFVPGAVLLLWLGLLVFTTPFRVLAGLEWILLCTALLTCWWGWDFGRRYHGLARAFLLVLVLGGSLLAWYALILHQQGLRSVWWLERPTDYAMRASATYMCPNHFANLLAILILLGVGVMFSRSSGVARRVVAGYSILIMLPALLLTQSRSGILGLGVGLGVTLLLLSARRGRKCFLWALFGLPTLAVAAAAALWFGSEIIRHRFNAKDFGGSAVSRVAIWRDSWPMVTDSPWFGHGGGSYRWLFPSYKGSLLSQRWVRYAHNEYIHTAADYGLPGLALFAVLLTWLGVALLRAALRSGRDGALAAGALGALVASAVHACFDFNFHIFGCVLVLALVIGLCLGLTRSESVPRHWPQRTWRSARWATALALATLAVFSGLTALADARLRLGRERENLVRPEPALRHYRAATRLAPWYWEGWLALSHEPLFRAAWTWDPEERAAAAAEGLEWLARAEKLNAGDGEILHRRANLYAALGDETRALEAWRELVRREPFTHDYRREFGLYLRSIGQFAEALEQFEALRKMHAGNTPLVRQNLALLKRRL
ncbi:MAG: O-antigen ligase family protein, partial [Candidatus Marinimicrobia bacterium]|nr:O-antigen ligase family protein [Candidatus Neomarinimicrobiota bacterium]